MRRDRWRRFGLSSLLVTGISVACASKPTVTAPKEDSQESDDDYPLFHKFRSHATPSFVLRLNAMLEAASKDGRRFTLSVDPIPEQVLIEFRKLATRDQLEFAVYRGELERPYSTRWLKQFKDATPELEEALTRMFKEADDRSFALCLLLNVRRLSLLPRGLYADPTLIEWLGKHASEVGIPGDPFAKSVADDIVQRMKPWHHDLSPP